MVLSLLEHVVNYFSTSDHCPPPSTKNAIILAKQRVKNLLSESGACFTDICQLVEQADNKNDLEMAFELFNKIIWTLKVGAPTNNVERSYFRL